MKKILIQCGIFLVLVLIIICMGYKIREQNTFIDSSQQTISAYAAEKDSLYGQCKMFKMDITTLQSLNDSIMDKMYAQAKALKIKDNKIKSLQYRLDNTKKTETVYIRDTIFREPAFSLDTCFSDKWSKLCLHMSYPNKVKVDAEFNNEQYVVIHTKKVPIKPRKWFLPRWFTRKRIETIVEVHSENPYVTTPIQRFIEIED